MHVSQLYYLFLTLSSISNPCPSSPNAIPPAPSFRMNSLLVNLFPQVGLTWSISTTLTLYNTLDRGRPVSVDVLCVVKYPDTLSMVIWTMVTMTNYLEYNWWSGLKPIVATSDTRHWHCSNDLKLVYQSSQSRDSKNKDCAVIFPTSWIVKRFL